MIPIYETGGSARAGRANAARVRTRITLGIIAAVLSVLTFEYRFSTMGGLLGGFEDDQFVHLSEAQQIVLGELPSRDFVDIGGMPLTLELSALAQYLG